MDYNNYDRGYAEPAMTSADYMSRTYRWMACGLLVTFAAAFVTATTPLLYVVNSLYLLFTIAELALVFVLSSRVQNMSVGAARGVFLVYALLNGMVLGFGSTVLYSGIGLVVFMLLTAYDTQKLSQLYSYYAGDSELAEKASIYGALTLYLDFINIFLYVVRLLGLNSRNSRS